MAEPMIRVLPHSPKEFDTPDDLQNWIKTTLRKGGKYLVAKASKHCALGPGSICLFMKSKKIVGEGILKDVVLKYHGKQISPATGKVYEGILIFDISSIRLYKRPIDLAQVLRITGKNISFRSGGDLLWNQYGKLLPELIKHGFY